MQRLPLRKFLGPVIVLIVVWVGWRHQHTLETRPRPEVSTALPATPLATPLPTASDPESKAVAEILNSVGKESSVEESDVHNFADIAETIPETRTPSPAAPAEIPKRKEPSALMKRVGNFVLEKAERDEGALGDVARSWIQKQYEEENAQSLVIESAKHTSTVRFLDTIAGEGPRAECGSHVEFRYHNWVKEMYPLDASRNDDAELSVQLGKQQIMPGLAAGIIGMREGGKRRIVVPPALGFDDPRFEQNLLKGNETISYEVLLQKVSEPISEPLPKIFLQKHGTGETVLCGMRATLLIRDGDNIHRVQTRLGARAIPVGIERAAIGRKIGDSVGLTLPPSLQHSDAPTPDFSFPTQTESPRLVGIEILSAEW